jgi:hypothetical protein
VNLGVDMIGIIRCQSEIDDVLLSGCLLTFPRRRHQMKNVLATCVLDKQITWCVVFSPGEEKTEKVFAQ